MNKLFIKLSSNYLKMALFIYWTCLDWAFEFFFLLKLKVCKIQNLKMVTKL